MRPSTFGKSPLSASPNGLGQNAWKITAARKRRTVEASKMRLEVKRVTCEQSSKPRLIRAEPKTASAYKS